MFLWVASALVITLALPASTFAAQPIFYRSISIGCPSYPQTDIQMVLRFVAKASS